jgi:hypothetical protein
MKLALRRSRLANRSTDETALGSAGRDLRSIEGLPRLTISTPLLPCLGQMLLPQTSNEGHRNENRHNS